MRSHGLLVAAFLVLSLVVCGLSAKAEELTNDSGKTAVAVRITFASRVVIRGHGREFPTQDPATGRSDVFVFSGGEVRRNRSFEVEWSPDSRRIKSIEWLSEWLTTPPSVEIPQGGLTREDLMNLGRPPTYEEIMAAIAEYPGPEEPLYEAAPDEAIWLTDLEGHVDIYDNDSIKINYADWFDRSQITKIEVYRNGIKMRFLPDMFDVLTNEQMKTFDGNPLEHSPESEHTNHAIFGYDFRVLVRTASGESILRETRVRSPVRFDTPWYYANILSWFFRARDTGYRDSDFLSFFNRLKRLGFRGVALETYYFMESLTANTIFSQHTIDPDVREWLLTPTDAELLRVLALLEQAGLEAEIRMQVWLTDEFRRAHDPEGDRSSIRPSDIRQFFENYGDLAVHLAAVAERGGADMFVPLVEMNSLEPYETEVKQLLDRIDSVFSGRIAIAESTNHYLLGFNCYDNTIEFEDNVGRFWDWTDASGSPLVIGMDAWNLNLETQMDQRLSTIVEGTVGFWQRAVDHYRKNYPGSPLIFSEVGAYNYDGQALGWVGDPLTLDVKRDDQEFADIWAGILIAAEFYELDGIEIWSTDILEQNFPGGRYYRTPHTCVFGTPALRIIRAIVGSVDIENVQASAAMTSEALGAGTPAVESVDHSQTTQAVSIASIRQTVYGLIERTAFSTR